MNITQFSKINLVGKITFIEGSVEQLDKPDLRITFEVIIDTLVRTGNKRFKREVHTHLIIAWGNLARFCLRNLRVGSIVQVEGRPYSRPLNKKCPERDADRSMAVTA